MFKPCIVVPVYKHANVLAKFITQLKSIPLIIVDDGNSTEDCATLKRIAQEHGAVLLSNAVNMGKGKAMQIGFRAAFQLGYTHVLQIDADAQHDGAGIENFLSQAEQNPDALINSYPIYNETAKLLRVRGRKLTNYLVGVETCSKNIIDAMCGLRIYPLKSICKILENGLIAKRMGFDIEIIVKAHRAGINIINLPVNVSYPANGYSNFRMVGDNIEISKVHMYLITTMILWKIRGKFK